MTLRLSEIAELVGGQLSGDGHIVIHAAATIRDAKGGEITLADRPALAAELAGSAAAAALVPAGFTPPNIPFITVPNVHQAFARIVAHFRPPREDHTTGVNVAADVSPTAKIGANVVVHAGASVGEDVEIGGGSTIHSGARIMAGCRIGQHVVIFPNAVLYENTLVGDRAVIHAGAVLGSYGFGYEFVDGRHRRSAQLGYVEIGADVEIGAASTIDRGTYGPTVIGEGTKIDNQVQVAHNCRIGKHNLLCSQVGVAGSATTGDYVVLGGQVGVRDHVNIGRQAKVGAKAGVMSDVPDGAVYIGIPATPERDQKHMQVVLQKLPELRKQLRELEKKIVQLTAGNGAVKQNAA